MQPALTVAEATSDMRKARDDLKLLQQTMTREMVRIQQSVSNALLVLEACEPTPTDAPAVEDIAQPPRKQSRLDNIETPVPAPTELTSRKRTLGDERTTQREPPGRPRKPSTSQQQDDRYYSRSSYDWYDDRQHQGSRRGSSQHDRSYYDRSYGDSYYYRDNQKYEPAQSSGQRYEHAQPADSEHDRASVKQSPVDLQPVTTPASQVPHLTSRPAEIEIPDEDEVSQRFKSFQRQEYLKLGYTQSSNCPNVFFDDVGTQYTVTDRPPTDNEVRGFLDKALDSLRSVPRIKIEIQTSPPALEADLTLAARNSEMQNRFTKVLESSADIPVLTTLALDIDHSDGYVTIHGHDRTVADYSSDLVTLDAEALKVRPNYGESPLGLQLGQVIPDITNASILKPVHAPAQLEIITDPTDPRHFTVPYNYATVGRVLFANMRRIFFDQLDKQQSFKKYTTPLQDLSVADKESITNPLLWKFDDPQYVKRMVRAADKSLCHYLDKALLKDETLCTLLSAAKPGLGGKQKFYHYWVDSFCFPHAHSLADQHQFVGFDLVLSELMSYFGILDIKPNKDLRSGGYIEASFTPVGNCEYTALLSLFPHTCQRFPILLGQVHEETVGDVFELLGGRLPLGKEQVLYNLLLFCLVLNRINDSTYTLKDKQDRSVAAIFSPRLYRHRYARKNYLMNLDYSQADCYWNIAARFCEGKSYNDQLTFTPAIFELGNVTFHRYLHYLRKELLEDPFILDLSPAGNPAKDTGNLKLEKSVPCKLSGVFWTRYGPLVQAQKQVPGDIFLLQTATDMPRNSHRLPPRLFFPPVSKETELSWVNRLIESSSCWHNGMKYLAEPRGVKPANIIYWRVKPVLKGDGK